MRYAVHPTLDQCYAVVDRRYPLRPVFETRRALRAWRFALGLSLRSAWGW